MPGVEEEEMALSGESIFTFLHKSSYTNVNLSSKLFDLLPSP